jgi:hypothetical protein
LISSLGHGRDGAEHTPFQQVSGIVVNLSPVA